MAEVFVRVNSGGQKLTEKNFIETLLAVYDNDVHDKIDKFCADSRIPKDGTAYDLGFVGRYYIKNVINLRVKGT